MKLIGNLFFWIITIFIVSCTNAPEDSLAILPTQQSDSLFISSVSTDDFSKSLTIIDSFIKTNSSDVHKTALLYFEKGRNLANLEKDAAAIGSLEKALTLFEKENNNIYVAKTKLLLGDSNAFLAKKKEAMEYVNSAILSFKELGEKKLEAKALNSLAHVHFQENNFQQSIALIQKAADIQSGLKDFESLSATYNNIGYVYEHIYDYENAVYFYEESVKINKDHNRHNSFSLRNLGRYYNDRGNTKLAKKMYLEALSVEDEQGHSSYKKNIYDALLLLSIKDKNFDNSRIYMHKRDSIIAVQTAEEKEEKLSLVRKEYDLLARDKQLAHEMRINKKNQAIFIIGFVLLFLTSFILYQRSKNARLNLLNDKMELEQTVLRSQMNPHFIFNALSAIQNSLLDNDPLKSASYLSRFARLIRQNFDFINESSIPLIDELDSLRNYMDTQKLRFADRFTYEIDVTPDVDINDVQIPPLLIQPFVENAIEHGFRNKKDMGKIIIQIYRKESLICYEIKDNGVGYLTNKKDDKIHAIDIFEKRLKLLGEKENTFDIQSSKNGTVTKFCLKV